MVEADEERDSKVHPDLTPAAGLPLADRTEWSSKNRIEAVHTKGTENFSAAPEKNDVISKDKDVTFIDQ